MRTSEDRLSGETMQSLTEFHAAIASKKKESKESEVQQMSSFFASSSIPGKQEHVNLFVCVCVCVCVCMSV